jgi:hypothetical protein
VPRPRQSKREEETKFAILDFCLLVACRHDEEVDFLDPLIKSQKSKVILMLKQLIKKMRTIGTKTSTCNNVNEDVAGGRKTLETAIAGTNEDGVLVNVASGDAIVFSDEIGSVPSLESEDSEDSDYESEEESDEEEEGKLLFAPCC